MVISHKINTFAKNRIILMQLQKILNQLLVVSILVGGCQTVDLSPSIVEDDDSESPLFVSNKITPDVVKTYLTGYKGMVDTKAADVEISAVVHEGDTVMYLVNYPEGGWELLSADRRVPTRLMVGESGMRTLNDIKTHPGMSILLDDMSRQIKTIMQSTCTSPVAENGILWDRIDYHSPDTKSNDILWNLYDTEVVYLDSIDVRHLIKTHWGQSTNGSRWYNRYVPYINSSKTNTSAGRCVVGCVPVSAGQMLAYLVPKIGVNTTCTFSECLCNSYVPSNSTSVGYGDNFIPNVSSNMSNSVYWNKVRGLSGTIEEQDKVISVLLAYLGYLLDATYEYYWDAEDSSYVRATSAYTTDIPEVFLDEYNIKCDCVDWNHGIVSTQISNNKMPVIVRAHDDTGAGHSWIVDGYYHMCSVVNYYYVGVDPSTNQTVYRTEQRVGECEEFFTMNWGWFGDGDDGSYYIDSSTWKTEDDELPLKNGRKIVYGFTH